MKTRNLILMIVFCLSINISSLFPQNITEEFKQKILSDLSNSSDSLHTEHSPYDAVNKVIEYDIAEAESILINNIWKQNLYTRKLFLQALYMLKSPSTHQLSLAFIDSVDTFKFKKGFEEDRLEYKAIINEILFELNDFTRRNYVYNYIESNLPNVDLPYRLLLEKILTNFSKDDLIARSYLVRVAREDYDDRERVMSLLTLYELYGAELLPIAMEVFVSDTSWFVRNSILTDIIGKYKTREIHTLFMNRVLVDPDNSLKMDIADSLIHGYGSPMDFYVAKKLYLQLVDTSDQSYYKKYVLDIFKPQRYDSLNLFMVCDSLFSYQSQCTNLLWLGNADFSSQLSVLLTEAFSELSVGDSLGTAIKIKQYQSLINEEYKDSLDNDGKFVTSDGYKFLYYYPQYILERLPKLPAVKLEDSEGNLLPGGSLQYYESGWKDAINNSDGTFSLPVSPKTLSLKMTYAYGSQTKSNITVGTDTVTFQTVNANVELRNSSGSLIDQGTVQYYSSGWREFGTTTNGVATKELLANNYTFRMTYGFASNDKAQNIGTAPTVVFQTVNANVELRNSSGSLIDQGTVQYYSSGWREFGTTTNGVATKELLANNYTFRMTYGFASNDKAQNIGTTPTIVFQTVNTNVELRNSSGNLMDAGTVQYYSSGWREFGTTTNGVATKELLANNYTFRMTYGFASNDKAQNIGATPTVVFQTVNANVELRNSSGSLFDQGTVQYYSSGWREFGTTANGVATKELLANNYTFRMTHEYISNDKAQNIGTNSKVIFPTVLCTISVKDLQNQPVNNARASYYSSGWRLMGETINGEITKELLPASLTFRVNSGSVQLDKTQNLSTSNLIEFTLGQ